MRNNERRVIRRMAKLKFIFPVFPLWIINGFVYVSLPETFFYSSLSRTRLASQLHEREDLFSNLRWFQLLKHLTSREMNANEAKQKKRKTRRKVSKGKLINLLFFNQTTLRRYNKSEAFPPFVHPTLSFNRCDAMAHIEQQQFDCELIIFQLSGTAQEWHWNVKWF